MPHGALSKSFFCCSAIDSSQLQQFTLSSRDNLLLADDGTAIFSTPLSYHGP